MNAYYQLQIIAYYSISCVYYCILLVLDIIASNQVNCEGYYILHQMLPPPPNILSLHKRDSITRFSTQCFCLKYSIWATDEQAKRVSRTFSISRRYICLRRYKFACPNSRWILALGNPQFSNVQNFVIGYVNTVKCINCADFYCKVSERPCTAILFFIQRQMSISSQTSFAVNSHIPSYRKILSWEA